MPLRRRAVEPGEPGRRVLGYAIAVEQQLPIQRLRLRLAVFGQRTKKRRALPGIFRNARGSVGLGGSGRMRQNLNSTVPNTVRPGAIVA